MLISRVPLINTMIVAVFLFVGSSQASDPTAQALFDRAEAMRAEGRYVEAELLYREVLAIHEGTLGVDRAETIPALLALMDLYHVQGRDWDAEIECRRLLATEKRTLDPLDPAIAATLNNLGEFHRMSYRYVSADSLYRRALAIFESTLWPSNVSVARVINNMASLQVATLHYEEARALFQKALYISEESGAESSQIATILCNIGICAMAQGKFSDAEPYLLRSIRIEKTVSGETSPMVLSLLEKYALVPALFTH